MLTTKVRILTILRTGLPALLSFAMATGCGGGGDKSPDAAPGDVADAQPSGPADAAVGVVCEGAEANYPGSLNGPTASDDGTTLEFRGVLEASDVLRIAAESVATAIGEFDIELSDTWSVEICIDDGDETCTNSLPAYSGTLTVTSVEGRFQASLDRFIFVDSLETPTCSASVSQSSIDVAILGPI